MKTTLMFVVSLSLATFAGAATYHIGTPFSQKPNVGGETRCGISLYNPGVFQSADGHLNLFAQGGDLTAWNQGIDSLYRFVRGYNRYARNYTWSTIAAGSNPAITGKTMCDNISWQTPDLSGPVASPSFVTTPDGKRWMAYVAGNSDSDYERGRVNWARVSSPDGGYLEVYPTVYDPVAIIQPTGNNHAFCDAYGIGQVNVAFEDPFIYFFLMYYHHLNPSNPLDDTPRTVYEFRIKYNKDDAWGLGTTRELWDGVTGQWIPSDGNLVFDYEGGAIPTYGDCPPDTDCTYNHGLRNFGHGTGDVQWNQQRNAWLHVYYPGGGDHYVWQEAASLASGAWSEPAIIEDSQLAGNKRPGPAIWYGDLSLDGRDNPTWYIFSPIDRTGCGDTGGLIAISEMPWY